MFRPKNMYNPGKLGYLFCLTLSLCTGGILIAAEQENYQPLYAGTQLAFYSTNADPGRLSVQPFIFAARKYGLYDSDWTLKRQKHIDELSLLLALETGITEYLDISLVLDAAYSHFGESHSWLYGDTVAYLGWQVLRDQKGKWIPDFRLVIGESFPTGKHQHLNPRKGGSDISGTGAFETIFLAVLNKIFYLFPRHPFDVNLNIFYILSSKTKASGFSAFGGAKDTRGVVKPGDQFIANLGLEYSFDRNWALGIDIHYIHQNKSHFSGKKGRMDGGNITVVGFPSSEQISLAPCIEYSWSEDFSVAGGPWFTVAGRNSIDFFGLLTNVFYYF